MKFGIRVDVYVMLVSSCGFVGSRCSERDTLLGGMNEILPFFYSFLPIWKEIGTGDVHRIY